MGLVSTSWKKGQSGNPAGLTSRQRQYVQDVKAACRKHSGRSVRTLAKALNAKDCPWPSKIQAASILLDRGYGKPSQTIDVHAIIGAMDLSKLTPEELDAFEALVLRTAAGKVIEGAVLEAMPRIEPDDETEENQEDDDA